MIFWTTHADIIVTNNIASSTLTKKYLVLMFSLLHQDQYWQFLLKLWLLMLCLQVITSNAMMLLYHWISLFIFFYYHLFAIALCFVRLSNKITHTNTHTHTHTHIYIYIYIYIYTDLYLFCVEKIYLPILDWILSFELHYIATRYSFGDNLCYIVALWVISLFY